ncbi:WYL domain-containing protein [Paenibacillus amylolyticus]|nr:WYL domain-containing protein [Paenibacillus amylolyticus]WFR61873.1 WYL domain-containing protein [Paenibacillus amylolyticus]
MLKQLQHHIPDRHYILPHLDALLACIPEHGWLNVLYRSVSRQRWLHICPARVYASSGFWYCEAYSIEHGEERLFRVDRMIEVKAIETKDTQVLNEQMQQQCSKPNPQNSRQPWLGRD